MSRWRATSPPPRSASSTSTPTAPTGSATGTPSIPTCWRPSTPRSGPSSPYSGQADTRTSGCSARSGCPPAGRRCRSGSPRDRDGLGLLLRRGAPAGSDDWTTLPDASGHPEPDTGNSSARSAGQQPFLAHYQTDRDGGRAAGRDAGDWWAAPARATAGSSGRSTCRVRRAARSRSRSPTPATTSFSATGSRSTTSWCPAGPGSRRSRTTATRSTDGPCPAPPQGSAGNANDWIVGRPTTARRSARTRRHRSPGSPRSSRSSRATSAGIRSTAAGGIVDDLADLGFALENQTRPIYSQEFFADPAQGDAVVVHELAHQWFGDSSPLGAWKDIWLNEGFATYAEWLWSEHEGLGDAAGDLRLLLRRRSPTDDPFWTVMIGDPGPDLFDGAVYFRGAMTLHALRMAVGDEVFFEILRAWSAARRTATPPPRSSSRSPRSSRASSSTSSSRRGCTPASARPRRCRNLRSFDAGADAEADDPAAHAPALSPIGNGVTMTSGWFRMSEVFVTLSGDGAAGIRDQRCDDAVGGDDAPGCGRAARRDAAAGRHAHVRAGARQHRDRERHDELPLVRTDLLGVPRDEVGARHGHHRRRVHAAHRVLRDAVRHHRRPPSQAPGDGLLEPPDARRRS